MKIVSFEEIVEYRTEIASETLANIGKSQEEVRAAEHRRPEAALNEDFLALLRGKPIEKQLKHYRFVTKHTAAGMFYGERGDERTTVVEVSADEYDAIRAPVVRDGVLRRIYERSQIRRRCLPVS